MSSTVLIAGKPTIKMGLGLMGLTLRGEGPIEDDIAFEVIKTSLDSGSNLLNTALFYKAPPDKLSNLRLLGRFFEKYPEYKESAIVSVKGGMLGQFLDVQEILRNEIQTAKELLIGKEIDIFATARVPDDRPFEETIKNLIQLQSEGLFKTIGLSEVSSDSVKLAYSLIEKEGKKGILSSNEIEVSLQTLTDPKIVETIRTCQELGVAVIGYSPFGHGLLSGKISRTNDLAEKGDWRSHLPRFQGENLDNNLNLVDELNGLAEKNGRTIVELVLASLNKFNPIILPLPGSIDPKKVAQNVAAANVELTDEEMNTILQNFRENPVVGTRYPEIGMGML